MMRLSVDQQETIRALQREACKLKVDLSISQKWSERWKRRCYRYREANAAAILRSTDALDLILDRVTEIENAILESQPKYRGDSALVLGALDKIRESSNQCLMDHARDFNINQEVSELTRSEDVNARLLRLVYSRPREVS